MLGKEAPTLAESQIRTYGLVFLIGMTTPLPTWSESERKGTALLDETCQNRYNRAVVGRAVGRVAACEGPRPFICLFTFR